MQNSAAAPLKSELPSATRWGQGDALAQPVLRRKHLFQAISVLDVQSLQSFKLMEKVRRCARIVTAAP